MRITFFIILTYIPLMCNWSTYNPVVSKNNKVIVKSETKPVIENPKHIIIGDSQTPYVDINSDKVSRVSTTPGQSSLWEGGKTVSWLITALEKKVSDSTVVTTVVCIGTNGGFGKFMNDDVERLITLIKKKFPNSDILVVQGSWGWGGLKNIKESEVREYYSKWTQWNVTIVEPPIGNIEPHGNKPIYKKIGHNIDSLISIKWK